MKRNYLLLLGMLLLCQLGFSQQIKKIKITDLAQTIAASKTPLIVNFWASFCKPCLEEMPYFQEQANYYSKDSIQLLFVSLDLEEAYPAKMQAALQKQKITSPVFWLDEFNADYFCPKIDSSWSGAIPATLFVNNKTGYRQFFEEQLSREKLQKEIMAIRGTTN